MNADTIIQEIGCRLYEPPLSAVRVRDDFPSLASPLDIAILLIDCDTEIAMNGLLGFLENLTGAHLDATVRALALIGAERTARQFADIQEIMRRHCVSWDGLRSDFKGSKEFEISSFSALHGREAFTREVSEISAVSLFQSGSVEDVYRLLCDYLDANLDQLNAEIQKYA
jgi:hypothetical protein